MISAGPAALHFKHDQALLLHKASTQLALHGGPDAPGTAALASPWATALYRMLDATQRAVVDTFATGCGTAVYFQRMKFVEPEGIPEELPAPDDLIHDMPTLYLASLNKILLHLVRHRSFAFDIDNHGKQIRLVGNFKGGGQIPLAHESESHPAEVSSHAGVRLGLHTEPPYHCAVAPEAGHSPAPGSLILTAQWNALNEPTSMQHRLY